MFKTAAKVIKYTFGANLSKSRIFIGNSLDYLQRERVIDKNYMDYIRLSTLELVATEISNKKLRGNVAELGVYKGKFARYINQYFPDRVLYLFDTFEGFDKRDVVKEVNENFSSGKQDFSDTSIDAVLKIMPFPNQCKPVKGFFPASAVGVDDDFVFVSIDTDLSNPYTMG